MKVRMENTWHDATPFVNVDDVWFQCKAVYVRAENQWWTVYRRTAEIIPFPTRRYEGELQDVCVSAA